MDAHRKGYDVSRKGYDCENKCHLDGKTDRLGIVSGMNPEMRRNMEPVKHAPPQTGRKQRITALCIFFIGTGAGKLK
jgi:hypothetical protein